MKMFSRQFPIKRTNSRGHTTIIEGPNLFCQKSSFHSPQKKTSFKFFHTPKNKFFQKHSKSSRQSHFFQKMKKSSTVFNGGLFQQILLTWNENICERSKKIEVKDKIQKTDGVVLGFLAQYEVYGYLKKW